jgi:hypothetical protein
LFSELGAPRALAYVARTPFRVENDNMHESALRYQRGAREFQQDESPQERSVQAHHAAPDSPPARGDISFILLGLRDGAAQ